MLKRKKSRVWHVAGEGQVNTAQNFLPTRFLIECDLNSALEVCELYLHHKEPPTDAAGVHSLLYRLRYHMENIESRYLYMLEHANRRVEDF